MKYAGNSVPVETRELVIPRTGGNITLQISAVSIGVRRDFDAVFPKPAVPLIITEGKNGRKSDENYHDPKWRALVEEREYLQNIYIVYRVIKDDPKLSFENDPITLDSLRALSKEFSESGFSEGDLLLILKEALRASNLSQSEVEAAKADF